MGAALDILSWLCFATGGLLGVIGAVGLLRFPDFCTRVHAASVSDMLCAGLISLGLMLQSDLLTTLKLLLLLFILAYTGPTAIHALVKTARRDDIYAEIDEGEGEASSKS